MSVLSIAVWLRLKRQTMLSRMINLSVTIWQRLITPHPLLQQVEERRQAQLLAVITLGLSPIAFLSGLLPGLTASFSQPIFYTIFSITTLVTLIVFSTYLLARTPFYRIGVVLIIVTSSTAIYTSIYINGSLYENPLHYLIIPILLCNLFFNARATIFLIVCIGIAILLVPFFLPTIAFIDLVIGPIRFMLVISPLLLLFGWYRRQVEHDRRSVLAQSEHRYRIASELTSDFTYSLRVDADGRVTTEWASGDFANLTSGENFKDVTQQNWMEFVHPDDKSLIAQAVVDVVAGKSVEGDVRFVGKRGVTRWIHYYARPEWNASSQQVTHIYGAAKDISDRKATEAAERDQRNFAEALRDTAAILNSTLEPETVLDHILANVARVVPHDAGSIMMLENGLCRVVRHHDVTQHENEKQVYDLRLKIDTTATLRHMYHTRHPILIPDVSLFDGWLDVEAHRWIRAFVGTPICIADEVVGFLTLDSRITNGFIAEDANRLEVFANQASIAIRNARLYEALSNEAFELDRRVVMRTTELDRERRQLRAILDAMGEGMFYTEDQTIVYTNPALSQLTGYKPEELKGQTPHLFGLLNHLHHSERIWREEVHIHGRDGKSTEAAITITLASEPSEIPARAVVVVRDIGQEKSLQAQKRQFVAIASHELRTPLTNMNTRLYLIRHQPERLDEHVRVIEEVVQDMQALTEDLLDLARYENRKVRLVLEPVLLQDAIRQVVEHQHVAWAIKHIHLLLDLPESPVRLMADVRRLRQVMTNLITNAFNYTPEEGYVTIQLTTEPSWAVISIADTGVGIQTHHLKEVFEPFFRVHDAVKGTGLGLSITREIIQLHGGTISVESEHQQGSRFTVRLPLGDPLSDDD